MVFAFMLVALFVRPIAVSGYISMPFPSMPSEESSGDNIMLNKPSRQSSTVFQSERANDGNQWTYSRTELEPNPVWQGDLLAHYVIERITIMAHASSLDNAYIGISDTDKFTKPDSEVIVCGQWPVDTYATLSFFCNEPRPMRYVRIWVNDSFQLYIGEVVVKQMVGSSLKGMKMNPFASKRVSAVMKSLQVNSSTKCANACFMKQHCGAFSFNMAIEENCLLASSGIMLNHGEWVTYQLSDRSFCP